MADKAFAEPVIEPHADALDGLEDRIQKAVSLVSTLRREREVLSQELTAAQSDVARLTEEITSLREERTQVRGRIEKLLGHIDQISL
jgi:FtsZ-binding cell division protein ZapB